MKLWGGLLCLFHQHVVCLRLNLTWIIFPVCRSATRPEGTRPYSSCSSSLTALLFSLDSCETICAGSQPRSFEFPWINAQTNFWEVKPDNGQSPVGSPGILAGPLVLWVQDPSYPPGLQSSLQHIWIKKEGWGLKGELFSFAAFSAYDPNWGSV